MESFCDLDRERVHIYALLSAMLSAPAKQDLIEIINNCHIGTESWQALKNDFSTTDLASLDDEYHRLFIGVGVGELLPYYSHYLTNTLMGKPLSDLKDDFHAIGLEPQTTQKDPADHIAGIFEIMRVSITDLSLSLEQQKAFFKKNILSWVDDFFVDLIEVDDIQHYHLVARFGQWFIQVEKQYFDFT
ncbi:Putative formate dehydrogenase-specific chaperone [uncultured Candidatus Thioglobus sp.]|nr:Putative formate dehydrogenase-specific chaperone [uncultured Candidatus Thioglobus sp.]SMM98895.1 Putative formate dehydrogenase-specific chaperone [uncultured Candidatus Thioglobus sp.]